MSDDNVIDLTVEILKDIRGELRELRGDVGGLRTEMASVKTEIVELRRDLSGLGARVDRLEEATIAGFTGVRRELDRLGDRVEASATSSRDLDRRVTRLERRRS